MTKKPEDWKYSSFSEYIDPKASGLVDRGIAAQLLDLPDTPSAFVELSWKLSTENLEKVIF